MFVLDDYAKAYLGGDEELRIKIEESHNYIPNEKTIESFNSTVDTSEAVSGEEFLNYINYILNSK